MKAVRSSPRSNFRRGRGEPTGAEPASNSRVSILVLLAIAVCAIGSQPGSTRRSQVDAAASGWGAFRSVARGNEVSSLSLTAEGQRRFVAYIVFRGFGRLVMLAEFTASRGRGHVSVVNSSYTTGPDTAIAVRDGRICIAWLRYKPIDGTSDARLSCRAKGSHDWAETEPLVSGYYSPGSLDLEAGTGGWVFSASFNGHVQVSTSPDGVAWGEATTVTTNDENAWASSTALQGRRVPPLPPRRPSRPHGHAGE